MALRFRTLVSALLAAAAIGMPVSASADTHAQSPTSQAGTVELIGHPVASAPAIVRQELAAARPEFSGQCGGGSQNWVHVYGKQLICVADVGWSYPYDPGTLFLCSGNNNGLVEFLPAGVTSISGAQYDPFYSNHYYNFGPGDPDVTVVAVYINNWGGGATCNNNFPF